MNRRNFLKGLVTLGVSAAIADKLVTLAEAHELAPQTMELAQFRPPAEVAWVQSLRIMGCENEPRPVDFQLWREGGDCPLIQFGLNAYGGMVYWRAMPGEEVCAMRAYPLTVVGNFDGIVQAICRTDRGTINHEFIMTRGQGVTGHIGKSGGRIYQLDAPVELRRIA